VGAGHALAPIASLVAPLRRAPRWLAFAIFLAIGASSAYAARDRLIRPAHRLATEKPKPLPPAGPSRPGAPIERAPLIPRRK
jgi:hypothetical protein